MNARTPDVFAVSNRALCLYAFTRRGVIELALGEFGHDPRRVAQAETARRETAGWLDAHDLRAHLTEVERSLLVAGSGTWPPAAVTDSMWRKEALGVLLWSLKHLDDMPPFGAEFVQQSLDEAIVRYGSVDSFRAAGSLRGGGDIEKAWQEADAWHAATDGATGEDAALASAAAERTLALSWLRGGAWSG